MSFPTDTIAALATPKGTSAIAVVRVSGTLVSKLTEQIFGALPSPRTMRRADYRDTTGQVLDDVLFTLFPGPNSFTGEDVLEVSCHGNPLIAQKILEDLLARGCVAADPGDFSKRAFLHGRMDLSQAEAIMDLIHARSERALVAANRQLRGALTNRLNEMTASLVRIVAQLEAYIDFPDEDLPPEDRTSVVAQVEVLLKSTQQLLATSHYGSILREGVRVVIVGEPNAGKSSLLNRLVGRDRALVSPEKGTTRDYLEEPVMIGPHAFRIIDTAGLNTEAGELEGRGIEKALEQAELADIFLWVIDLGEPIFALPERWRNRLRINRENTVVILNKTDRFTPRLTETLEGFKVIAASALEGAGIKQVELELICRADRLQGDEHGDALVINARHAVALTSAVDGLASVYQGLASGDDNGLLVSDLRMVMGAFGEIGGRIDHERVLDELFASFCIGK